MQAEPSTPYGASSTGFAQSSELRKSHAEEATLRRLLCKIQRPLVGLPRVFSSPQSPKQVGAGGMSQVVVAEVAAVEDGINEAESGRRPIAHGHGHRAV